MFQIAVSNIGINEKLTDSQRRATVLMSGGIDSSALAYHLLSQGFFVEGRFVDYGQLAAKPEFEAVCAIAKHLEISVQKIVITGLGSSGSGELVGRNALLIFSVLFGIQGQPGLLGIGVHAGTAYFDCSPDFVTTVDKLVAEHTDGKVSVVAPFLGWSKKDVFDYFVASGLPVEVTFSCEAGTIPTCGVCASCRDREALGC
jgi:7-cyano-7-deazaguanine synthase